MSTSRTRAAGILLAAALGGSVAGCSDSTDTVTPGAGSPSSTASTSATEASTLTGTAVYWVAESRRAFRLYREFRDVPDAGGRVASAVAAMTRLQPLDPDYTTPWRPASRVSAAQDGSALTVDLSRDALASTQVGSELAGIAVQQLVYTATAAAQQAGTPATTVRILVDGAPADAWGSVHLGDPMRRAPLADVQAQVWVTSPQQGQSVRAGRVRFEGFGTSFEATFGWQVLSAAGAVVARGSTMGGRGDGTFGTFAFSTTLAAGTYTVKVSTDDPSGGAEGAGPAVDDKRFTVA